MFSVNPDNKKEEHVLICKCEKEIVVFDGMGYLRIYEQRAKL